MVVRITQFSRVLSRFTSCFNQNEYPFLDSVTDFKPSAFQGVFHPCLSYLIAKLQEVSFCDGHSRRTFLQIGAMGSLTLPQLLQAEAASGVANSHKAVITVYLCGGPPHQDMYDLKPDAPAEVRGEFSPIKTNVPGVEIRELMPKMASMMDKFVPIRTMANCQGGHTGFQCFTGNIPNNEPAGGWPHIGSVVSKFQGPVHDGVPLVSLCYTTQHKPYNEPKAGFLGLGHSSFRPSGPGKDDLVLKDITTDRLGDRKTLLASVDRFRRNWDNSGQMEGMIHSHSERWGF